MGLLAWPALLLCLAFPFLVGDPREGAEAYELFEVVAQGLRLGLGLGLGQPKQQPKPGHPEPGQPGPGQPKPGQPKPGQPKPGQPMPGQPKPGGPWLPGLRRPKKFGRVLERRSGGRYGVA